MESKHGLRYVRLEFKEESQNLFLRYDCKETKYTKTISRVVEDRYATEFIYQMKEKGLKKDSFGFYGDRKDKRFTLKQMKYQFKSYCKKNRFSVGGPLTLSSSPGAAGAASFGSVSPRRTAAARLVRTGTPRWAR